MGPVLGGLVVVIVVVVVTFAALLTTTVNRPLAREVRYKWGMDGLQRIGRRWSLQRWPLIVAVDSENNRELEGLLCIGIMIYTVCKWTINRLLRYEAVMGQQCCAGNNNCRCKTLKCHHFYINLVLLEYSCRI